ncbi:MAG TPA: PilZ domain-containing protein [Terriglobales bacterium]|nr:PilZ domain-containing protein [Terriglobales bacterium]
MRAALVGLEAPAATLLSDCFRQFGIEAVAVPHAAVQRLNVEKFEAGVLVLDDQAAAILTAIRSSRSNSRMVVYGIARSSSDALKFSQFGLNVILDYPIDRQNVLRAVRSTHLLVLHELRRYVRVPLVAEVIIETATQKLKAVSCEVSSGGMSLHCRHKLPVPSDVQVHFELPGRGQISVRSTVCWARNSEDMIGIRFHPGDERRVVVRGWTDEYLGIR